MGGWNKSEVTLNICQLNDDEKFAIVNDFLFSEQFKTSTYKYCLFKIILDNIYTLKDNVLTFDTIGEDFARIYWNLINVYDLPQTHGNNSNTLSSIELLVHSYAEKYHLDEKMEFDILPPDVVSSYVSDVKKIATKYVVGALCEEFQEKVYGFSKKEKKLYFNPDFVSFFQRHKVIYDKLNFYQWLLYIEKILKKAGMDASYITDSLDNSSRRNSLAGYKEQLGRLFINKVCFYCGKPLSDDVELDHFIPWNFYKKDVLWNFVYCCKPCNASKNKRVPDEEHLKRLIQRNQEVDIIKECPEYQESFLITLYRSAIDNGIRVWKKG